MEFTIPYQIIKEGELNIDMVKLANTLIKICPKSYDAENMVEYFYDNMEEILTEFFGLPEETYIDDCVDICTMDDVVDNLVNTIEDILKGKS